MSQYNPPAMPHQIIPITLLGQRQPRIPTAGKIRAGIKVLSKSAASNPRIKALYDDGLSANATFEEIERRIADAFPNIENPLIPKNVAWFTVRPNDFPNPVIAEQIFRTYGEDRGDGVTRLYRFPVMFPADHWQAVMPHELACWTRNEKRYWSEYGADGHTRYCKMHAPARMNPRTQRVVRTFGGRETQTRPDNDGRCDPESCPEFQKRQCNLSGRFIFYIPGIKSLDAFELHTNSFYALSRAIERFETIAFLRGGRLAGFLDRQHTPFFLTKKLREVSHLDPKTGQPVRSAHWIIELEAPVDVSALLIEHDRDTAIQLADKAVRTLEGDHPQDQRNGQVATILDDADNLASREVASEASSPRTTVTADGATTATQDSGTGAIYALAAALGVAAERLDAYADWHWGVGWRRNAQGCARVLAELQAFRDDAQGLIDKIADEIGE